MVVLLSTYRHGGLASTVMLLTNGCVAAWMQTSLQRCCLRKEFVDASSKRQVSPLIVVCQPQQMRHQAIGSISVAMLPSIFSRILLSSNLPITRCRHSCDSGVSSLRKPQQRQPSASLAQSCPSRGKKFGDDSVTCRRSVGRLMAATIIKHLPRTQRMYTSVTIAAKQYLLKLQGRGLCLVERGVRAALLVAETLESLSSERTMALHIAVGWIRPQCA